MNDAPARLTLARILSLRWPPPAATAFCFLLGTILPAVFGALFGVAEPVVHDEFAYLLGADTFAQGRLANPTPLLPAFFEAPHVLMVPTYASKYPPGQSLFLALGQLAGTPIWGVWLSCGVFAAALHWMLQGWSSRELALGITILMSCTLGMSSYWAQSYWGGMPAAIGGALLLGGVRNTCRAPRVGSSVLMGLGVLFLANTRPYEGLLLCVPAVAVLAMEAFRRRRESSQFVMSCVVPCAGILIIGALAMAYYNQAVTGSAWQTPYGLHLRQYVDRGVFLFSPKQPPERHPPERIARFYEDYAPQPVRGITAVTLAMSQVPSRLLGSLAAAFGLTQPAARGARELYRGASLWIALLLCMWARLPRNAVLLTTVAACLAESLLWFYVPLYPIPLWMPVVGVWLAAFIVTAPQTAWTRFIVIGVAIVVSGQALVWWWWSHYSAPIVPLVLAGVAVTLQHLSLRPPAARPVQPLGTVIAVLFSAHLTTLAVVYIADGAGSTQPSSDPLSRAEVMARLESQGGRHLVFVRYSADASPHVEWVYNRATIDDATVVFAHDLGTSMNDELIAALPGRQVWDLSVSKLQVTIDPYRVRLGAPATPR